MQAVVCDRAKFWLFWPKFGFAETLKCLWVSISVSPKQRHYLDFGYLGNSIHLVLFVLLCETEGTFRLNVYVQKFLLQLRFLQNNLILLILVNFYCISAHLQFRFQYQFFSVSVLVSAEKKNGCFGQFWFRPK